MGFLKRLLNKYVGRVDDQRATLLKNVLEEGEVILNHVPVRSLVHPQYAATGERLTCILFVTNSCLRIAAFEGPRYREPPSLPGPHKWRIDYSELLHVILSEAEKTFLLVLDRQAPTEGSAFPAALELMAPTDIFEPELSELHTYACVPLLAMGPLPTLSMSFETLKKEWEKLSPPSNDAPYNRFRRHPAP